MKTWDEMDSRSKDALVATEVMGSDMRHEWDNDGWCEDCGAQETRFAQMYWDQNPWHQKKHPRPVETRCNGKPYSTDIGYAWEVVEKMEADGWRFVLHNGVQHPEYTHRADFHDDVRPFVPDGHHVAGGVSAPEAICLAALRAKGIDL